MKELKKPNKLESTYSELGLHGECPNLTSCPDLRCFCRGIASGDSPEEEEEVILA